MEITATAKFIHISPKKVQPWLKSLRLKQAILVLDSLKYSNTKAGQMVYKVIASAVNNAVNNYNFKPDNLRIKLLAVDEGPRHKRYWFRSHGSADVRLKRMSHIKVVLEEIVKHNNTVSLPKKTVAKGTSAPTKINPKIDKPSQSKIDTKKSDGIRSKKSSTTRIFSRTTNK